MPKGEYAAGEDALAAARREFEEELGSPAPPGEPLELGEIRQRSGKRVRAWALAGDLDRDGDHEQHARDRVAAPLGPADRDPRGRPGRVVRARAGAREDQPAQATLLDRLLEQRRRVRAG